MRNHTFRLFVCLLAAAGLLCACQPESMPAPLAQATAAPTPRQIVSTQAPTALPVPTLSASPLAASPTQPEQLNATPFAKAPPTIILEPPTMNDVPVPTPLDARTQALVAQVKADLAQRLTIEPAQIELDSISSVTWPDSSLGCPKPGMAYTQVMVDGLRIRLKADGQIYEYHGASGKPPFLCKV